MTSVSFRRARTATLAATLATAAAGLALVAPATASAAPITKTFTVQANTAGANGVFFDTGINLPNGATASVTATGSTKFDPGYAAAGPDGSPIICPNVPAGCALNGGKYLALVGKVGTAPAKFLGKGPTTVSGPGEVRLAINDVLDGYSNNTGSYQVSVTYTPPCQGLFCFGS